MYSLFTYLLNFIGCIYSTFFDSVQLLNNAAEESLRGVDAWWGFLNIQGKLTCCAWPTDHVRLYVWMEMVTGRTCRMAAACSRSSSPSSGVWNVLDADLLQVGERERGGTLNPLCHHSLRPASLYKRCLVSVCEQYLRTCAHAIYMQMCWSYHLKCVNFRCNTVCVVYIVWIFGWTVSMCVCSYLRLCLSAGVCFLPKCPLCRDTVVEREAGEQHKATSSAAPPAASQPHSACTWRPLRHTHTIINC